MAGRLPNRDRGTVKIPAFAATLLAALVLVPAASASQLIARNTSGVHLEVNNDGQALITYTSKGAPHRVLAWGAVNARPSLSGLPQVAFNVDYSGGWGTFRRPIWKEFRNTCAPADVDLTWLVAACRASDGSYWALQSWQRTLHIYGIPTIASRRGWELRLSHWTGPVARLDVRFGWTYRRFQQIYGRLTYRGLPVYGFQHKPNGEPLDDYGRNVYLDTFDSAYGPGWRRENGFLTHKPTGGFCYGFYPHGDYPSGRGTRYRATVMGPGVTPDVFWQAAAPKSYSRDVDLAADTDLIGLLRGDPVCRPR
jgi:hypothetical protein